MSRNFNFGFILVKAVAGDPGQCDGLGIIQTAAEIPVVTPNDLFGGDRFFRRQLRPLRLSDLFSVPPGCLDPFFCALMQIIDFQFWCNC